MQRTSRPRRDAAARLPGRRHPPDSYTRDHATVTAPSRRTQLIGAVAAVATGLVIGVMVHVHPEGLRAPAWVAYAAASAFVLAGLCLLAGAPGSARLQRWLGIAVTLPLLAVGSWVAFGPGERACSMSIPFLDSVAPEALCRGAFGAGSILIGLFLGLSLHRALRPDPEG